MVTQHSIFRNLECSQFKDKPTVIWINMLGRPKEGVVGSVVEGLIGRIYLSLEWLTLFAYLAYWLIIRNLFDQSLHARKVCGVCPESVSQRET